MTATTAFGLKNPSSLPLPLAISATPLSFIWGRCVVRSAVLQTVVFSATSSLSSTFKLWSIGQDRPKQLNFREELMHSLVKLFGSNQEAVQASRGANASVTLVRDHHLVLTEEDRDCVHCSSRPAQRTRSRYKCSKCQVHLCVGDCFHRYHAHM
jgi:hypothetical protein